MKSQPPDPRYTRLYRLGGIAGVLSAVFIVLAIAAYFIWPYTGNTTSIDAILSILQTDRLGGLIALDISIHVLNICSMAKMPHEETNYEPRKLS